MRTFFKMNHDLLARDLDASWGVHELAKDLLRSRLGEAFQTAGQALIEHGCRYSQSQVKVHVQPNFAGEAVEMEEPDFFP